MKMIKTMLATVAFGVMALAGAAQAQDKGTIGIAMPTKSSARWISDGNSMVQALRRRATRPTCSTRKTISPTSSPRSRT